MVDDCSFIAVSSEEGLLRVFPSHGKKAASSKSESRPTRSRSILPDPSAPDGMVRSVMPGRVVSVEVSKGDKVMKGQVLAVLESMKMENSIASPFDGVVSSVLVSSGDTVQHGQTLFELAPRD